MKTPPAILAHPSYRQEIAVGVGVVIVAMILRAILDRLVPGTVPFALLFPAVLLASLAAGWRAGALAAIIGGLGAWYLVMEPRFSLLLKDRASTTSLLLFAISATAIIATAELFRRRTAALHQAASALKESEDRLSLATEAAGVGVWEWRIDTGEMIYSRRAREISGLPPTGPISLEMVRAITHPDDLPETWAQASRALDPGVREHSPYEYRILLPGGATRWVMARGEAVFEERDGAVVASRYVGVISDISEDKRAAAQVKDSELQLRLALEAGRMAVWQVDGASRVRTNPALNQLLGYPPEGEPDLEQMRSQYLPGELERLRQVGADTLARGERFFEVEFRFRRVDGAVRWLTTRAEIRMGADGAPLGAIGVVLDTTERREGEERTRLLAHEVDHRANNLMSVVQGTVMLSQAASVTELKSVIVGRIRALARAHQLLSEARWVGADMRQLISEELHGFNAADEARIEMEGEAVSLPPAAAQSVGLVIHELTTNAAKYGALSVPDGRIEVSWRRIDGGRLGVSWREHGGPAVTAPSRHGFGTSLMQRALSGPLDGRVDLDWRAEGLAADLELRVGD